jgi:hypothetical protein
LGFKFVNSVTNYQSNKSPKFDETKLASFRNSKREKRKANLEDTMGWKKITLMTGLCLIMVAAHGFTAEPIVKLDRISLKHLAYGGFSLTRGGDFVIKGVGLVSSHSDDFIAYGWLIDSATRKPIWVMDRQNTERKGREGLRQTDDTINLKAGKYELYYYAAPVWSGDIHIEGTDVFQFLGDLFDGNLDSDIEDNIDELNISVSPVNAGFHDFSTFIPDGGFSDALIRFNKVGDSKFLQQGFTIDKPMTIHIYGFSEHPSGDKTPVDYAWIMKADSHDKVWEMDRWNSDPAGGGRKNRVVDTDVNLEKGDYVLVYVSDDSHSWEGFNTMPPYDPLNWGVTLMASSQADRSAFHLFTPKGRGEALISLTRIGDDESVSQAFKLDKDMSIRILCLGEWSGEFSDYGWIENASTGRTVWEMTYRNTVSAGGASKNRMFDGAITLSQGTYMAHYTSDDSHSYGDWNDSQPYEPEAWGISIYPGTDFDKTKFHVLKDDQMQISSNILIKMTGLGDDVNKRSKFTLSSQTKIRIYAVGEGDTDEMYDYGWIVNDRTGRTVWEMTWRNTEPAGGARKNRMFDDTVILEAGTYEVHFVTDGSHSFNDWNSARPRDPASWGITISVDKNKSS